MNLRRSTLTSPKFARRRRKLLIWKSIIGTVLVAGVIVGFFYLTNLRAIQIVNIKVIGNTTTPTASIDAIAESSLQGDYLHFIPKRDTFFLSKSPIENAIRSQWLRINSVSIKRDGFNGITITLDEKKAEYDWCGGSESDFLKATATSTDAGCYLMDAASYIFDLSDASTSPQFFKYYGPLEGTTATSTPDPLGAFYATKEQFDYMNQFLAALPSINITPIAILKTNEDEADIITSTGLKLFISDKEDVATAIKNLDGFIQSLGTLTSTATTTAISLGSIDSIDMRYDSKIYYKAK